MDATQLFFGILWGALGLGYFIYGRRQRSAVPLLCGFGLMLFPYFVDNWIVLLGVGLVLTILPFVLR